MREIERVERFDFGEVECRRCGKKLHLYYNGGELDSEVCCDLLYRTEHVRTDLVIYDQRTDQLRRGAKMMQPREYRHMDKSDWGEGPWQHEPDKLQWRDEATGLPCLAVRAAHGGWCGYVGLSEGHPYFQAERASVPVSVHGGLTFEGFCQPHEQGEAHGICHAVEPGEPERVWWLGFDCAHAPQDLLPALVRYLPALARWGTYRDLPYVQEQVRRLAAQLALVAAGGEEGKVR